MNDAPAYVYAVETNLAADDFIGVLRRSGLSERRPVDKPETIAGMLAGADVTVTARTPDGLLVGVSRAISDRHWCTYLADLAVDEAHQQKGVGRELIRLTHEAAGRDTHLILLAAPAAEGYYPHVGLQQHHSCWMIPRQA